jgi:hypothetical protein
VNSTEEIDADRILRVRRAIYEARGVASIFASAILGGLLFEFTSGGHSFRTTPQWVLWTAPTVFFVLAFVTGLGVPPKDRVAEAEVAYDQAREKVLGDATEVRIQEAAIRVHTERLQKEIEELGKRAGRAFQAGLVLCISALSGPGIALYQISKHADWHYLLGGSAVAAVLLGAGAALLRHDNKSREQIQVAKSEYLYFSRLATGLACAQSLKQKADWKPEQEEYRKALAAVTAHLLAAPPNLTRPDVAAPAAAAEDSGALSVDRIAELAAAMLRKSGNTSANT